MGSSAAIGEYGILDTPPERSYDDVVLRAASLLESIRASGERLHALTLDALLLRQLETAHLPIDHDRVAVSAVAAASVTAASPIAAAAGVELRAAIAPEVAVAGDAGRLAQALDNLVSKALTFTPAGGTLRHADGVARARARARAAHGRGRRTRHRPGRPREPLRPLLPHG